MNKKWLCCLGTLGAVLLLAPVPTSGGIAGSAHDFSAQGWSGGKVCLSCHTPHNADATVDGAPLWNHEVTAATYTLYGSPSMVGATEQPRSVSRLCLSCHDGTVALDSFGGVTGGTFINDSAKIETNLTDDHPISIRWQHQNDMSNGVCLNCHSIHPPAFVSELPFFDGYVECATCHDVHNGTQYGKLLRMSRQGSQLCLHCHGK